MRWHNQMMVRQRSGSFFLINQPIQVIVENPIMRDSHESYFIQVADCAAFLLKQRFDPSTFMKKHGGNAYFNRLDPVLCKFACNKDPQGVVRI